MPQSATLQNYLDYAAIRNADSSALEDLTENFDSVQAALRNLSADPVWQHFREETRITTVQPYTTGTVEVVDGATSLAGTTTTWADDDIDSTYVLKLADDDTEYPVASVTDNTNIVLKYPFVDKGLAALTGLTYKLIKRFYLLPDNFRQLIALKRATASVNDVRRLTPEAMKERSQLSDIGGMPEYYSLLSVPTSTRKALRFLPYPEGDFAYQYDLSYTRWPTALVLASPSAIVDWPPEFKGLLEKAIEVEIARKNKDPQAEQAAIAALSREMPQFEKGAEAHGEHRLLPIGVDESGYGLDEIQLDASGA